MEASANNATGAIPEGTFRDLVAAIGPVAERFTGAGHRLYLVGGQVRDRLLDDDRTPDHDLTTDATPDRIRELVADVADAVWLQGERFGTIGIRVGDTTMEVTTHRAEAYTSDSRKPVVRYTTVLAEDLARRDFTVNAMAVDVADEVLHDPFGGRSDLADRILRTPLDPVESFSDDPLRMLRAARFLARYELTAADGLVDAARSLADRIEIVSVERIRDELFRLLSVEDPSRGFDLLEAMGLLPIILPEVAELEISDRARTVARMATAPPDPIVRLAVLAWATGGVEAVDGWAGSLRLSGRDVVAIRTLVDGVDHVTALALGPAGIPDDTLVRRLAAACGDRLDDVVAFAGLVAVAPGKGLSREASAALVETIGRLRACGELDDLGPAFDGAKVMECLGLGPGPEVGEVLAWLVELRITEGRLPVDEVERRMIDQWSPEPT
ncbi:MAG: CCA tRNA nucleotidyltransferase [Actinomycetota bacterium]|nr:CCA tRNA nucleotidyltransferase [Actinomycetota bacterium]